MAEEDDDKPTSEDVKKAKKAYEELIELEKKRTQSAEERIQIEEENAQATIKILEMEAAERKKHYESEIEEAEKKAARHEGLNKRTYEARVEYLKKLRELNTEEEREAMTAAMDDSLSEAGKYFSKMKGIIDDLGSSVNFSNAKVLGFFKVLGMPLPTPKDALKELFSTIEESTRSLIPFNRNTEEASQLMNRLRDQSFAVGLPMSELAEGAVKAATSFALFGAEEATVRAELSALESQMGRMGVSGASDVISSLITEGGIQSVSEATERFKALTSTMQNLGVTPQQLKKDFDSLIPSLAMFGSTADINIAKASLAAQKARVDVGAITAFADQFEGYSGAAQAAQRINAIFGKPIIRDPAELVRTYYTMGPEGVVSLVREKMINAGFTEGDFEGAAGAARLRALSKTLGITSKQAQRIMTAEDITPEEISGIMDATDGGTGQAAGAANFDKNVARTLNAVEALALEAEQAAAKLADAMGMQVGDVINKVDPMIRAFGEDLSNLSFMAGQKIRPLFGEAVNEAGDAMGRLGISPTSPPPSGASELNEATKKNTEALNANTEALRQFASQSSNSGEITVNLDGNQFQKMAINAVNKKAAGKIIA